MACARCQGAPCGVPHVGTLYLTTPIGHIAKKLRQYAGDNNIPLSEPYPDILAIPLEPERMTHLLADLPNLFSSVELQDCKAFVAPEGEELSFARLMQAQPLGTILAQAEGEWLMEMIQEERLTAHFQPIVHCNAPTEIFAYEALMRGKPRDGGLVFPGRILSVAKAADLLFNLDSAARRTAIREAAAHNIQTNLFVNFTPTSIYDPKNCLRSTLATIEKSGIEPGRIVWEVVESEHVGDVQHLLDIFRFYRDNGFKVALDDVGAGYSSMNLLAQLQPDYMKLDMTLVRDVDREPYKAHVTRKLLEMAQVLNVRTVAEGVESEGEYLWLCEQGVDYVQGYFFAKPAAVPPLPEPRITRTVAS